MRMFSFPIYGVVPAGEERCFDRELLGDLCDDPANRIFRGPKDEGLPIVRIELALRSVKITVRNPTTDDRQVDLAMAVRVREDEVSA